MECYIAFKYIRSTDGIIRTEYYICDAVTDIQQNNLIFNSERDVKEYINSHSEYILKTSEIIRLIDKIINPGKPLIMSNEVGPFGNLHISYGIYIDDLNTPVKSFLSESEARLYATAMGLEISDEPAQEFSLAIRKYNIKN